MPATLTLGEARRAALAAQGFGRPRPDAVTMAHVQRVIDRVAQFQIDSVSVAVRAHYMPLFARLGAYDAALLERASAVAPRRLYEFWGHAASLIDVNLEPALRLKARRGAATSAGVQRILDDKPGLAERILDDIRAAGPLTAREIDNVEQRTRDHWGWNWSEVKHVLEHLFGAGVLGVAGRNPAFERRYDLLERVLPPAIAAQPDPDDRECYRLLVARAARALGVADLRALSEYFYLRKAPVSEAVADLVAAGLLEPVGVAGLPQPFWRWHEAAVPRRVAGQALVSPFDTLVFERTRLEELFGVNYRIEIYVPAAQRRYGYYVYLFLADDAIAARVDLKAARAQGRLEVRAAWVEDSHAGREDEVARRLAAELATMAGWLGLGGVTVDERGTLAGALRRAVSFAQG